MTEADAAVAPNHEKKTRVNTSCADGCRWQKRLLPVARIPCFQREPGNYAVAH